MLVAALIDAYVDRLFSADPHADDILAYRAQWAGRSPALSALMDLSSQRNGVRLSAEAVAIPVADYAALAVEDFMVSLYNDHSIQRLQLVLADGSSRDMMDVLEEALAAISRP